MKQLQKLWYRLSQIGIVVKVFHAIQIALPLIVGAWAAISALADNLPQAQVIALGVAALAGTLICVTLIRVLLGIPVSVRSQEDLAYGLAYSGVHMGFNPALPEMALQFGLNLSNCTRSTIRYEVERLQIVIGNTTLSHKSVVNTGTVIPLMGHRVYRDSPFTLAQVKPLLGSVHRGVLEAHIAYGRPDTLTRRYKLKLDLTVGLGDSIGVTDAVTEEVDEPIF